MLETSSASYRSLDLAPGDYMLHGTAPGWTIPETPVTIDEGGETRVELHASRD